MFKQLFSLLILFFITNNSLVYSSTATIKSYSQQSNWKTQEHHVYVEYILDGEEGQIRSILTNLSIEEMIEFDAEDETLLTILDESPDALVFQSLFQFQIGENPHMLPQRIPIGRRHQSK